MKQLRRQRAALARWQSELERNATLQSYPPGIPLLQQGMPLRDIHVLQSGLVKLVHTAATGNQLILGLCSSGDWLGLGAAAMEEPVSYSAITVNNSEVFRLSLPAYFDWLNADREFARQQHELLSQAMHWQMQHAIDLICASARQRLEQALWWLAQSHTVKRQRIGARSIWLQLPLQQQELASWVAVTPSHLSRLFKEMEDAKLLRRVKGWYVLTAPEKLWRNQPANP